MNKGFLESARFTGILYREWLQIILAAMLLISDYLLAESSLQAQQNSNSTRHYLITQGIKNDVKSVELPEVRITGSMGPDTPGNPSYTRTNASSATRTNLPIMQTPMSVQVIPRAVFEDQQAVVVEDLIKNVSGAFPGFTPGAVFGQFMLRGFNTGFSGYRDGYRIPSTNMSLANVERMEVVKGAAANLYGRIEPGGMINMITKRPQAESYYMLNQQFGSYGQYQTRFDATGSINETGTLLYRFNLEYLNKDSFRDFVFHKRLFLAPSVTWKIAPSTQLDVDFTYSDEDLLIDYGTVAIGNRVARLPRAHFLGEPTDKGTQTFYNSVVTLNHALNDNWQARARFNYFRREETDTSNTGTDLNELTGELNRWLYSAVAPSDQYIGNIDITGQFNTVGIKHQVLAGWEYYYSASTAKAVSVSSSPINIFNPQYSGADLTLLPYNSFVDARTQWNGVYFQDQITLFDKLHIMGGGRYDWASQETGWVSGISQSLADARAASDKINNARFSPRAGIVYQPWEWLSFYGNYVQSLGTENAAFGADGNVLKPQIGEQFEGGFKTSFFEGRLNSNIAYYYLTKQNLAVSVPGQPYSIPIGQARSQGVEMDISGQVAQGLDLILTYAYTDAEVLEGNNKGNRLWNVPKHAGSLWARYDMQHEPLRGLSIGAGIYVQSRRLGDQANTFFLPAQARVDAMIRYRPLTLHSRLSLQLNVYNLTNETLYEGTVGGNRFQVGVGAPRTFVGSIRYEM